MLLAVKLILGSAPVLLQSDQLNLILGDSPEDGKELWVWSVGQFFFRLEHNTNLILGYIGGRRNFFFYRIKTVFFPCFQSQIALPAIPPVAAAEEHGRAGWHCPQRSEQSCIFAFLSTKRLEFVTLCLMPHQHHQNNWGNTKQYIHF